MNFELMVKILDELGITYSYYEFPGPIEAKQYAVYFETGKTPIYANDTVWMWMSQFAVELYSPYKDIDLERRLIELFDKYKVVWSGGETTRLQDEDVYMTVFNC